MRTNAHFDSAGLHIAAHLHAPDDDPAGPRPAIVVGHPGGGVKEQTAGLYAARLAKRGFLALAFDAAFQGESQGLPRGLEDPAQRVEDVKAAVSYLATRDDVDAARIGALGICASGGYVVAAAATDHRIRAVATVSATDIGRQFREGADGTQDPAILAGMLRQAAAARTAEARGEGVRTLNLFPATADDARALGEHVFEGYEYYCTPRGQHPRSTKQCPYKSVDMVSGYDPFRFIGMIAPRPLLMIVGTRAATKRHSTDALAAAGAPKRLHWIDGASHVDLYDRDAPLAEASAQLDAFFHTSLARAGAAA